ncbi:MAG: peptide deformylase [Firmicutes bacterium HGW-Firmicutes-1]|jgi:peptide deformylase|nr:MAG: peptide deformylase [Firmicutes bacterium HGW-Firmicutes-1]
MAIRKIRTDDDPILRKISKPVHEITHNVKTLAGDMLDTMYEAEGVGLAAPQVGLLKRLVVIDTGEGPVVMINPEIVYQEGEQVNQEGCLSLPGKAGEVTRPAKVKAQALNLDGEIFTIEGEDLLARAICHEIDHLNGILFTDIAKNITEEE